MPINTFRFGLPVILLLYTLSTVGAQAPYAYSPYDVMPANAISYGQYSGQGVEYQLAGYLQPDTPTQPEELIRVASIADSAGPGAFQLRPAQERLSLDDGPGVSDNLSLPEVSAGGNMSINEALQRSTNVQTIGIQRRSPLSFEPHVRGFHVNQIGMISDHVQWSPARQDLDTILSKLDPSLYEIEVIAGPYGLRYGPYHSIINLNSIPTPRFAQAQQTAHTGITVRENGGQARFRETIIGGGNNYGYIVNYGHGIGEDYRAGNGVRIPSSYNARTITAIIGFDLTRYASVDVQLNRLDQTDSEFAGQFFDLGYLGTNGISVRFTHTDVAGGIVRVDAWHNRTRYHGNNENVGKFTFQVVPRVQWAVNPGGNATQNSNPANQFFFARTSGWQESSGARAWWATELAQGGEFRIGADVNVNRQQIDEQVDLNNLNLSFTTNLPRSRAIDPGLFAEFETRVVPGLRSAAGARVDFTHTSLGPSTLQRPSNLDPPFGPGGVSNGDILTGFYFKNQLRVNQSLSVSLNGGHSQRLPSLVDRYADAVFVSLIQNGFSRVIGDPTLKKEQNWQVDLSMTVEFENARAELSVFHSWINDYITYAANVVGDPTGARLLRTVNTDLATLAGFEFASEFDLTQQLVAFGTLKYLEGRDLGIPGNHFPLWQIYPMESRVGFRLNDGLAQPTWGFEAGARIVDNQDRVASLRRVGQPGVEQLESPTPGFTTSYISGFYAVNDNFHVIFGVDNLFDRTYFEHLDLRLGAQNTGNIPAEQVLSPGVSGFVGVEIRN